MPLVPIVSFWSTERSITTAELKRFFGPPLEAQSSRLAAVSAPDREPLARLLGVTLSAMAMPPDQVRRLVKTVPGAIGIVRAQDVTIDVRALSVDGLSLFGVGFKRGADWPLTVNEPGVASSFSSSLSWTLAAGGDVMLDRAVYDQSFHHGQGFEYPWNGGTAAIDRRVCCGWGGKPIVAASRTGNTGAIRHVLYDADVALVNLESPEPTRYRYHAGGFVFTGNPLLLAGIRDAGIDVVSLANNHLGNAGAQGILDTLSNLDAIGVGHAGAGANSGVARRPAMLKAGGLSIAILAYCEVSPSGYWATATRPGSSGYSIKTIVRDIRAAKSAGVDVVIVMPHWGIEYTDSVLPSQRADARAMVAAGADLILGSHSHWVGPFEQITPGHLAFYSLGDFVFDWTHDERTQEGEIAVLTFSGRRLVQLDLLPTVIIGGQPNLLDPAGDGQAVLGPVRRTSEPSLGW
jgi:poly-gamma-glutamate capsule biosynthesis protein CapA/YwtB (metallophosphatase superfamily)